LPCLPPPPLGGACGTPFGELVLPLSLSLVTVPVARWLRQTGGATAQGGLCWPCSLAPRSLGLPFGSPVLFSPGASCRPGASVARGFARRRSVVGSLEQPEGAARVWPGRRAAHGCPRGSPFRSLCLQGACPLRVSLGAVWALSCVSTLAAGAWYASVLLFRGRLVPRPF